ncbi:GNAT family N-acetyltransferase [Yeosuana sp. MJ-SS3]|uniref:GNAT family N-acetyltransferase n=1 Tax=Gilvirhabdus luticola TaxID=3079858 RepID=A0ABU3UA50_9FLAO|nr:GNAT family N-acetyltransferase [Yeosuana sp. MJ-SS3]MDU8887283.1 GNAT family N-acetyltransferase [Yeosuana sp. MJ-SS3]
MLVLKRTNSEHPDFINLVKLLDAYLCIVDGEDHAFYSQYNKIDLLNHVVVAYSNDLPVGCGSFKQFNKETVEIKRMYVVPDFREKGVAKKILTELELWAKELNTKKCVLETGKRQVEAVSFYKKNKYSLIPNFGPYIDVDNSLCFVKEL